MLSSATTICFIQKKKNKITKTTTTMIKTTIQNAKKNIHKRKKTAAAPTTTTKSMTTTTATVREFLFGTMPSKTTTTKKTTTTNGSADNNNSKIKLKVALLLDTLEGNLWEKRNSISNNNSNNDDKMSRQPHIRNFSERQTINTNTPRHFVRTVRTYIRKKNSLNYVEWNAEYGAEAKSAKASHHKNGPFSLVPFKPSDCNKI